MKTVGHVMIFGIKNRKNLGCMINHARAEIDSVLQSLALLILKTCDFENADLATFDSRNGDF